MTLSGTPPELAYIDGRWREARGTRFESVDPGRETPVWSGNEADAEDVADAVAAARAAFPAWSRRPLAERVAIARSFAETLNARRAVLADMISRETGKPAWEAAGEVGAMIGKVEISIAAYDARTGETETATDFGAARLTHRPHGVMGVFGPYNFPGHLPNGHIVPALIAGDTVVFKPSELTPAVGAMMVEAWAEAGAPPGVINLVQGGRAPGAALLDAGVDGVLFTGSVETGVMIHRKFAGRPDVILALEMGGNNPLIVWDATDTEAAANLVLHSAFITAGQRCSCARRLIIRDDQAGDALLAALDALLDRVRIGLPDADPEPFMGPLVSARAAAGVLGAYNRFLEQGGRSLRAMTQPGPTDAFLSPGVIDMSGLDPADSEVFGPLLLVWRESSFEAAVARANATKFGLAGGLISDNADLWARAQLEMRAGILNWNRPTTGAASTLPFGGPGYSGNHRPSAAYAADYCAYPMASQEAPSLAALPTKGLNG